MLEGMVYSVMESIVGFLGRVIMVIFVNWWKNQEINHIKQTVTHENIRIKASFEGRIPQITLSWNVHNRSMLNIDITRVFGELFIGAWRICTFDSDLLLEKHVGYNWSPLLSVTKKRLKKKGDVSEIKVTIFPSVEFWVMDTYRCALYNCGVEVKSKLATAISKVVANNLLIENADETASQYRDSLKNVIKPILEKLL